VELAAKILSPGLIFRDVLNFLGKRHSVDRMFRDAGQHVPQITFRIDAIQFCGSDQPIYCSFSATIRSSKEKVLSA